jgi:hypothetical protein
VPLLAKIGLDVAPQNLGGSVELRRDGSLLPAAAWTSSIPVDPGPHTIEASGMGKKPWKTTVEIAPKPGVTTVKVPALEDAPADSVSPEGARPFVWTTTRYAGLGAGIAGVAALAASGAVGGVAVSKYNAAKPECSPSLPNVCTAAGVSQRSSALHLADASTGLVIGGAVAAAAGVTLLVLPPSGSRAATGRMPKIEVSPLAGARTAGLLLRGRW